jgi:transcriptional regulator with XRE-family HTH domain
MDIGLKIKHLRIEKKWEQSDLAKKLNKSVEIISQYERGKSLPPLRVRYMLSEVFEVSPNYFLTESNELSETKAKSETITTSVADKAIEELKKQLDFMQRNFERVIEENGRLSRTIENFSANGNFLEGNGSYSSPVPGEVVILRAA